MAPYTRSRLDPERVAYWYFRLNGFLQIENFVVHPDRRGGQRTDADLLGVRFRHRAERAFDRDGPMQDDRRLALSVDFNDITITEVKTNQRCTLNGPWTNPDQQNVHRVLAAIGCLDRLAIPKAADDIYREGCAIVGETRIRLIAVGRETDPELAARFRGTLQLTWADVLDFIWDRHRRYRDQKTDISQWDHCGRGLHANANQMDRDDFIRAELGSMGIERGEATT